VIYGFTERMKERPSGEAEHKVVSLCEGARGRDYVVQIRGHFHYIDYLDLRGDSQAKSRLLFFFFSGCFLIAERIWAFA